MPGNPRPQHQDRVEPQPNTRRTRSRTSAFGVSERASHDSSAFYARRLYSGIPLPRGGDAVGIGVDLPAEVANRVYCGDSRRMAELPDHSVHLVVTSPPYAVGKTYDQDMSLAEYRQLLRDVFRETYRVLAPGGRVCINVANVGRKPYIPLASYITMDMLELGYLMRGEIIWDKGASAGGSCAWGSWQSASNPSLRDRHEYILVFSKEVYKRARAGREDTIGRGQFLEYTQSVWNFPTESARRVGHPAPFPVELPGRLIQVYTFSGDVVLDPFCGSGTTCVAALLADRKYVGYDIQPEYVALAQKRIAAARAGQAATKKPE